jgi:hypothetical protein
MLSEPLALVEVNVPGVMEMLVAPVAAQFSALVAPEFMLVGFAANEVMVGAEPVPVPVPGPDADPEEDLEDFPAVQPAKPKQMNRSEVNASE